MAIEGVERYNRSDDRIRLSLLAVDTHGYTNGAMAVAKLLGFDLCPRLQDLAERKLYLPPGFAVPEGIERATDKRLSRKAICTGWDELLRVVASIRIGKIGADVALRLLGSAAQGDPAYKAADHLGRLLRSIFLCDYVAIPDFRREIHLLLSRGHRRCIATLHRAGALRAHQSPRDLPLQDRRLCLGAAAAGRLISSGRQGLKPASLVAAPGIERAVQAIACQSAMERPALRRNRIW